MSKTSRSTEAEVREQARDKMEKDLAKFAEDRRGGNFFIIEGNRIHESDLTEAQRKAVGLPPSEKKAKEEVTDA